MGKKGVLIALVVMLFCGKCQPVWAVPSLEINGKAAVLLDANTKQVLYEKNKDEKLPPASITKILTVIIAIESGKMNDTVTVSANPPLLDGTRVYLEEGEKVKVGRLAIAALVHSANDAALAIAEYLGGTEENFARIMNEKAREIGAQNSNFVNAHGLHADDHYTTAYDIGLIACYAMQNETFRKIAQMKTYDWNGQAWQTRLINKNQLLWSYDGCTGIKTGYTKEAKCTIAASAERDQRSLIAVSLACVGNNSWTDAKTLLDYGFNNFQNLEIANPEQVAARVQVEEDKELLLVPERALAISVPQGSSQKVESRVMLEPFNKQVNKGQVSGKMEFYLDGERVGAVNLIAQNSLTVSSRSIFEYFLFGIAGIYLCQITWRLYRRYRPRKRGMFSRGRHSRALFR